MGTFSTAIESQMRKYNSNGPLSGTDLLIEDFHESSDFLDSFNLERTKSVIICGSGWNAPMIGWQRKVFRVAWKLKEQIPTLFNSHFEHIITHNDSFEGIILDNYPEFYSKVIKVANNGKVTIWKIRKNEIEKEDHHSFNGNVTPTSN